jgi:hypothetical protein
MRASYSFQCLCGAKSPSFGSRAESFAWHARHKREECAARRGGTTSWKRPVDAELAELLARAKQYKPIPVYVESTSWRDDSRDRWGAPKRSLLSKEWTHGNCVTACIGSLLGVADIKRIPDPSSIYNTPEDGPWFDRYNKRLAEQTGYRLERLPLSLCPPRDPTRLWIAGIRMDGPDDHVVVARGRFTVFDPLGEFMGSLPWDRVIDGWLVQPTTRVIPVFSPHRGGYAVVPA